MGKPCCEGSIDEFRDSLIEAIEKRKAELEILPPFQAERAARYSEAYDDCLKAIRTHGKED